MNPGTHFLIFLLAFPGTSFAQIIGFFPPADSISIIGSCVPPALICHLISQAGGVDTVDIRTTGDPMYAGGPTGQSISNCYFTVRDSLNVNGYQLWRRHLWPYAEDPQRISFDSGYYFMGGYSLFLRVDMGGGNMDSSQVRLYADARGGVDPDQSVEPATARLLPNFPNPFNPSTTIAYELLRSTHVRLTVHNMLGEEVTSLVDRFMFAGSHSVQLTMAGRASGVYVCRLQAAGQVHTTKILLLQ